MVTAVGCDAPARATVKNTRHFMARYGCGDCEKRGEHDGKRMTWVGCDRAVPRTNESFRDKQQPEHHLDNGKSTPLLILDIDMVSCFPPDFMQQGGGTMKKIMLWSGNGRHNVKMSGRNMHVLDQRIKFVSQCIPNVFARKLRTTIDVADYKYTKLRQLLLYTGKVLFWDLMACKEQYVHFLKYSVACNFMTDPETAKLYLALHDHLIKEVVDGFSDLYGQAFMTYNAHSNSHFPAVAARFGSLDNVSAYPFENHLGHIKKYIVSSHNPMIAMMKGVKRRQTVENDKTFTKPVANVYVNSPHNIYIDHRQHRCYEALAIVGERVKCIQFTRVEPFFDKPVCSTLIGCYKVLLSNWRLVYIALKDVQSFRRGIRINLHEMPGVTGPQIAIETVIFMAVLHSQQDALF